MIWKQPSCSVLMNHVTSSAAQTSFSALQPPKKLSSGASSTSSCLILVLTASQDSWASISRHERVSPILRAGRFACWVPRDSRTSFRTVHLLLTTSQTFNLSSSLIILNSQSSKGKGKDRWLSTKNRSDQISRLFNSFQRWKG